MNEAAGKSYGGHRNIHQEKWRAIEEGTEGRGWIIKRGKIKWSQRRRRKEESSKPCEGNESCGQTGDFISAASCRLQPLSVIEADIW